MAHPFDRRATIRRLEAAGLESPAAEAIAAAIVNSRPDPVTKADWRPPWPACEPNSPVSGGG